MPRLAALARDPARGGDGILDRGRKLVLRRQPVVDRNDDAARRVGERAADLVVALQVADHPAAAVEDRPARAAAGLACALAAIEPQRDRPAGPAASSVGNLGDVFARRAAAPGGTRDRPRAPPAASASPAAAGWRRRSDRTPAARRDAASPSPSAGPQLPLRPSSHARIVRAAAALGHHPVDVLVGVLDIAGLAVDAVLRVDHVARLAALLHPLVDARRDSSGWRARRTRRARNASAGPCRPP